MTTPTPPKKAALAPPPPKKALKVPLPKGTGAKPRKTRFFVIYSAGGKQGKTGACSTIEGAKWVISDPNCEHTLDVLGKTPKDDDIYLIPTIAETRELIGQFLDAGHENGGEIPVPAIIFDSATTLFEDLNQKVARQTGQSFVGQKRGKGEDNGWQHFNNEWGKFVDDLADLAKMVNVIVICHGKERTEMEADSSKDKSTWHGLSLSPKCAEKLGRTANFLLFCETTAYKDDPTVPVQPDELVQDTPKGIKVRTRRRLYTVPYGKWPAAGDPLRLDPHEPADMSKLMKKLGLL